jgi:hypothetical protein
MDIHSIIQKKMDVRTVAAPPILCWMGTQRHKLHDENHGRNLLAELFADLGFTWGAEVGVDRGYYSSVMLEKNPLLNLLCVDSWKGDRGEEHYRDAQNRLAPFVFGVKIVRNASLVAVKDIPDKSLDFVYIDSQRDFQAAVMDLIAWGKKVKVGGLLTGRGYCRLFETGIVPAVDFYTKTHYIRKWYITRELEPQFIIPITHTT